MVVEAQKDTLDEWFDNTVGQLLADQLQVMSGLASSEKLAAYEMFARGDGDEMAHHGKNLSDRHFFRGMMGKYLKALADKKPISINRLAFSYCDSQVLAWVEVFEEDYDRTERALILAEAEVNAEFYVRGYTMSTTIVETSDKLDIPDHYVTVNDEPLILK